MTLSDGAARQSIVPVSFNPTAENIARYLVETVGPALLEGYEVTLVSVRVDETLKCSATYERER
jgi:6-pyruvoyltetrahydropterin/6-carboxytetrahydropterin synthase